MRRRLYFVLPDVSVTSAIIADLKVAGIDAGHIRVASREPAQIHIQGTTVQDATTDLSDQLERMLWNINLLVFFVCVLVTLVMLATQGLSVGLLLPLSILSVSFFAGLQFTHLPNTHLREFSAALRHGELVLMVSVPRERVAEIEDRVHSHYPAAALGGVGWSSDFLHV